MGSLSTFTTSKNSNEDQDFMFALQLAGFSVLPMALKTAIQLDVLEVMAKAGPANQLSPSEIASHLPTENPDAPIMLDRILRLLASYSIITSSVVTDENGKPERRYGLGSVCKFLVKNENGLSLAPLLLMNHDKVLMESWYHLKDAVLDGGIPFNKAYGMSAFEYHGTDARFNKVFNNGMSGHSSLVMTKILEVYTGFKDLKTLVDVGGGTGATLNLIVSKYPNVKGVNFDLQHVVDDAPTYPGVENVGGDMFAGVPNADAIFMKWILHDWSDEHCLKLLTNCYEALPESGKVIVAEMVSPVAAETEIGAYNVFQTDLIMLAHNPGGKERTQEDFQRLAIGAGFSSFTAVCCVYNTWVMEFLK